MKIIAKDNFNRDHVSDSVVCENVNEFYAPRIVDFLNKTLSGDHAPRFYEAKPDDYIPYKFEP